MHRQIVHYDDNEVVKLKSQVANLREELAQAGEQLGYSNVVAETYRAKGDAAESQFLQLQGVMVKVGWSMGYSGR